MRQAGEHREPVDLLLVGEPPDVPDGQPAAVGPSTVQRGAASRRVEQVERDAASPQVQVADAERRALLPRGRRRHQGAVHTAVHPTDPAIDHRVDDGIGAAEPVLPGAVLLGEGGDVGLVDRDRRHPEPARGAQPDRAERDGGARGAPGRDRSGRGCVPGRRRGARPGTSGSRACRPSGPSPPVLLGGDPVRDPARRPAPRGVRRRARRRRDARCWRHR